MCFLLENFFRVTQQYVISAGSVRRRVLLRLVAVMGGKVLRTTRGISGAPCGRLGYAKFSPPLSLR